MHHCKAAINEFLLFSLNPASIRMCMPTSITGMSHGIISGFVEKEQDLDPRAPEEDALSTSPAPPGPAFFLFLTPGNVGDGFFL